MKRLEVGGTELGILSKLMRKVDFFAPLTVGQLEEVLSHVMLFSYDPGETVFRQSDPGDAFYIVYKGKVDVRLKGFLWLKKTVASLGEGDFFGEIALVSSDPRNAGFPVRPQGEPRRRQGDGGHRGAAKVRLRAPIGGLRGGSPTENP